MKRFQRLQPKRLRRVRRASLAASFRNGRTFGATLASVPEHELSFVDAAHIVPFSETRNDHPTNGLALCKNHHWALDQRLIAPDSTRVWRVSRYVEARRSRGEEELIRLAGQPLLAPVEPAFAPDQHGLQWRFERLLA